jgi:uncharacterized protein
MIVHSYITPKVKVITSSIDRRGVFCVRPIRKGEVLAIYGGFVIAQKEYDALERRKFRQIADYATPVTEGFYLVSNKAGRLEDDDFFNHSCEPNAGIKGHIVMVAMRNIRKGEEVTYDYCMSDAGFDYAFDCLCKQPSCRGMIRGSDWKKPALQKKYQGYFSWAVQERIDTQGHKDTRSQGHKVAR